MPPVGCAQAHVQLLQDNSNRRLAIVPGWFKFANPLVCTASVHVQEHRIHVLVTLIERNTQDHILILSFYGGSATASLLGFIATW